MKAKKSPDSYLQWRAHPRLLFDEIIQCGGDKTYIFKTPLQILMAILGEAAQYAAETKDEKMIGYFSRLALYAFSDPEDKDYDNNATNYYCDKTKD